jgi:hypothetical protein
MEEVVPRYPGMLGAGNNASLIICDDQTQFCFVLVFFLNYSWTYAMTWSIAKCVYFRHVFGLLDQNSGAYFLNPRLPESSFHPGRNFFNTVLRQRCHLVSHPILLPCTLSSRVFSDYGGALSPLHLIEDPLNSDDEKNYASVASREWCMPAPSIGLPETLHRQPSTISIPPRSSLNPFFGYPTIASLSRPHIVQQGRRRKRDLLLTLSVLWWRRWGSRVIVLLCFLITVSLTRKRLKKVARWMLGVALPAGSTLSMTYDANQ